MTLPCVRPLNMSAIFTEFQLSRAGNFSRMLGKANAPSVRPLNMSYFLCKSNITQAEIDAYINAKHALNAAESFNRVDDAGLGAHIERVFSQIHHPDRWTGYWDNFMDANAHAELKTALINLSKNAAMQQFFANRCTDYANQAAVLSMMILFAAEHGIVASHLPYYRLVAQAYLDAAAAYGTNMAAGWATDITNDLHRAPADATTLWGNALADAHNVIWGRLNLAYLRAQVDRTAKVITDKGGTLPTVT